MARNRREWARSVEPDHRRVPHVYDCGYLSVTIATILGVGFGLVGGYFGGIWEFVTMRSVDVLLVFPPILLAISVVAFLGPSTRNLILVIGSALYDPLCTDRVWLGCPGQVSEYVEAAKVIGAGDARILGKYILPNILAPIFVQSHSAWVSRFCSNRACRFLAWGLRRRILPGAT